MIGCRHSGVRIILPPSKIPNPTGIKCKLIRKETLPYPPMLKEGEGLACRALLISPAGSRFLGPVIIEVPHFASLRGQEREIIVLRSNNGKSWVEHQAPSFDDLEPELKDALRNETMQPNSCLVHIITVDLPRYFALVSRVRMVREELSSDGGSMSSTLTPKVKVNFPEDAFVRKTKVGLQAQPVQLERVRKFFGDESSVSPIVTIEPRRRKFHRPVSVTVPIRTGEFVADDTRLLCSVADGNNPAIWEDISDLTPLTSAGELVSFTTSVSGKYWLLATPDFSLPAVQKLYSVTFPVPYLSKFVIFAKRLSLEEGRLRVFCMTDDKVDKTLERQEQFIEVSRSDDVEVLEGTPQYILLEGNLRPSTNSSPDGQLWLNFHAFRENRLPLSVQVVNPLLEASGYMTFLKDPGLRDSQSEICTLKVTLPRFEGEISSVEPQQTPNLQMHGLNESKDEPALLKAELRLSDVAELIGENWKLVAGRLGVPDSELENIQAAYDSPADQAAAMLLQWMNESGGKANGNKLEKALRDLGMDDIIATSMCNIEDVTDFEEKAAARSYLDRGIDLLQNEMGSAKELISSRALSVEQNLSPDVAYDDDEQKIKLLSPESHAENDNKCIEDMFNSSRIGERFPFMDRSLSTISTNTLATLPSDVDTLYQSVEENLDGDQIIVKAEVQEDESTLEDGSSVNQKVITLRHFRHRKGSEDVLVKIEVDEEYLELPPGVTLPLGDDAELETSVEYFEETSDDGVNMTRKVTTTRAVKAQNLHERNKGGECTSNINAAFSPDSLTVERSSLVFSCPENQSSTVDTLDGIELRSPLPEVSSERIPVVEAEVVEDRKMPTFCSSPWNTLKWDPKSRKGLLEDEEENDENESGLYKAPSSEFEFEVITRNNKKAHLRNEDPRQDNELPPVVASPCEAFKIMQELTEGRTNSPPSRSRDADNQNQDFKYGILRLPTDGVSYCGDTVGHQREGQPRVDTGNKYTETEPGNEFVLEEPIFSNSEVGGHRAMEHSSVEPVLKRALITETIHGLPEGRKVIATDSASKYLESNEISEILIQQPEVAGFTDEVKCPVMQCEYRQLELALDAGVLSVEPESGAYDDDSKLTSTDTTHNYYYTRHQMNETVLEDSESAFGEQTTHPLVECEDKHFVSGLRDEKCFSEPIYEYSPESIQPFTDAAYKYLDEVSRSEIHLEDSESGYSEGGKSLLDYVYECYEPASKTLVSPKEPTSNCYNEGRESATESAYKCLESITHDELCLEGPVSNYLQEDRYLLTETTGTRYHAEDSATYSNYKFMDMASGSGYTEEINQPNSYSGYRYLDFGSQETHISEQGLSNQEGRHFLGDYDNICMEPMSKKNEGEPFIRHPEEGRQPVFNSAHTCLQSAFSDEIILEIPASASNCKVSCPKTEHTLNNLEPSGQDQVSMSSENMGHSAVESVYKFIESEPRNEFYVKESAVGYSEAERCPIQEYKFKQLEPPTSKAQFFLEQPMSECRENVRYSVPESRNGNFTSALEDELCVGDAEALRNQPAGPHEYRYWELHASGPEFLVKEPATRPHQEGSQHMTDFGFKYLESMPVEISIEDPTLEYLSEGRCGEKYMYLETMPKDEVISKELSSGYVKKENEPVTDTAYKFFKPNPGSESLLQDLLSEYPEEISHSDLVYEKKYPESILNREVTPDNAIVRSLKEPITEPAYKFFKPALDDETILEGPDSRGSEEGRPAFMKYTCEYLEPEMKSNTSLMSNQLLNGSKFGKNAQMENGVANLIPAHRAFTDTGETGAEDDDPMEKHARVVLRRRVHKKTMIMGGCQEETVVTEDTHIKQDNEIPKELNSAIQQIIEQFVQGESNFETSYNAC